MRGGGVGGYRMRVKGWGELGKKNGGWRKEKKDSSVTRKPKNTLQPGLGQHATSAFHLREVVDHVALFSRAKTEEVSSALGAGFRSKVDRNALVDLSMAEVY